MLAKASCDDSANPLTSDASLLERSWWYVSDSRERGRSLSTRRAIVAIFMDVGWLTGLWEMSSNGRMGSKAGDAFGRVEWWSILMVRLVGSPLCPLVVVQRVFALPIALNSTAGIRYACKLSLSKNFMELV